MNDGVRALASAVVSFGLMLAGIPSAAAGPAASAPEEGLLALSRLRAGASQSSLTEADGTACMGEDRSRKETQDQALADAKRMAAEQVMSFVKGETVVENMAIQKDLVASYTGATVELLSVSDGAWYRDPATGDCFRIHIRAEVVPDQAGIAALQAGEKAADDSTRPLALRVWTDKSSYRGGEPIKVYLRGNKPFFGRVVYRQANGELVQILPNVYRRAAYFEGAVIYEIPSGEDHFTLQASEPFGPESIAVYGSTAELGSIDLAARGGIFSIGTAPSEVAARTKGVKLVGWEPRAGALGSALGRDPGPAVAEFVEVRSNLETRP